MPSNPRSLAVTERYRAGMLDLRHRAEREAKRAWGAIRASDLDATYPVGQLALSVTGLQREGARLASAYLAAFVASETGNPVRTPPVRATVIGESRKGGPLTTVLRSPLLDVKQAIGRGTPPGDALRAGGKRLVRMVGLATDTAVREAQRAGMEDHPEIIGWRRAVRGTCDACVGAAVESYLPAGTPLEIHPNCQCVSEPQVRLRSAATLARTALREDQAHYLVTNYLGNPRGFDVNQYLRGEGFLDRSPRVTEKFGEVAKEMDRIFTSVPVLGERVQAWRGGPGLDTMHLPAADKLRGHTFTDKGFISTTHDLPYVENHNTLWNLTIDPRVKGIAGHNEKESELLLQRGCRFVITDAKVRKAPAESRRTQVVIDAVVLPP